MDLGMLQMIGNLEMGKTNDIESVPDSSFLQLVLS